MFTTPPETRLKPLVKAWLAAIRQAVEARKEFQEDADECLNFFCKSSNWLWSKENKRKFWTGDMEPKFRMTVNKAFEMVALFGPLMYHDNPVRTVTPRKLPTFPPELFGLLPEFLQFQQANEQYMQAQAQYEQTLQAGPPPQSPGAPPAVPPAPPMPPLLPPSLQDPMVFQQQQQVFAQYQADSQQQQQSQLQDTVRAQLMDEYLNYTPNEMPGGGLRLHSQKAVNDALLTGRGVLWTEPHTMPGGNTRLIVSEYDVVSNLLIDPDAHSLEDANFIIRKCTHPYWQVEEDYGYARGELKDYCQSESATNQSMTSVDDSASLDRAKGKSNDLLTYYKIWSKMGCGSRLAGVDRDSDDNETLDAIFGDYCYLVIADGVDFPLNLNPMRIEPTDDLASMLAWPVPYYADQRWPCTVLDFYSEPNCAWPKSPLAPGLGWLKFINVMMSSLANKIWTTQRTLIGVQKAAAKEVEETLKAGRDLTIIPIDSVTGKTLADAVSFLQAPNVQSDVWQILDAAMQEFQKATGLSDLLQGMNPNDTQSRSAADAQAKMQGVQIRPDYMAKQVEAWATEVARKEAMCARFYIEAQDIEAQMGPQAAQVWQSLVLDTDVEKVVRELEYRVEAGSAQKPNRDRKVANLNQALGQIFAPLIQYALQTGNVSPANAILAQFADANEWEAGSLLLTPPQPPMQPAPSPPPQAKEGSK